MSFQTHLNVTDEVTFTADSGALIDGTVVDVIADDLHDIEIYAVDVDGATYLLYADEVLVATT